MQTSPSTFFSRISLLTLGCLAYGFPAYSSVGTEGASFLDIPVGAGPASLGGAYTARASNVYGVVWNPAGIARITGVELTGQHISYIEGIHYEFVGAAIPLRKGTVLGAGIQYLGSGKIHGTANDGTPTGDFTNDFAAYSLALGQSLNEHLSVGLTAKWINAHLSDYQASAIAADVGAFYKPNDRLAAGIAVVNGGAPLRFIDQKDPLPLAARGGFVYALLPTLNLSLEGNGRRSGLLSTHTGLEWRPLQSLTLRSGYRTDTLKESSALAGLTLGAGLHVFGQEFAYAWLPLGDLGDTQYFSMLLKFGTAGEENRKNLVYVRPQDMKTTPWAAPATLRESTADLEGAETERLELMDLLSLGEPEQVAKP